MEEEWASAWKSCIGAAASLVTITTTTTTTDATPEPQVIREKVATQMWASVSIDYRETVAALLSFGEIYLSRRNVKKDG